MSRIRASTKGPSTASRPRRRSVEGKRHHGKRSQVDSEERLKHPAFPQPRRTRRAVWHYMTLAKFIAYWTAAHCSSVASTGSATTTKAGFQAIGVRTWVPARSRRRPADCERLLRQLLEHER
jgi:hypothetical protein